MATGTAHAPGRRWLYGPGIDLLVGCGGWYVLAFAALCLWGPAVYDHGGWLWVPLLSLLVSTPHYGATLLRAYEQPQDRRAYAVFTLYATAALLALFAWGVRDVRVACWILTVYITWSPWHYTGQNYGVTVMFLRRRGVPIDGAAKRTLHASFVLSYALTFVALHAGAATTAYAPVAAAAEGVRFLPLGLDPAWSAPLVEGLALAYGLSLLASVGLLLRRARGVDLLPSLALVALQALWFPVPLLFKQAGVVTGLEPWESPNGAYYFLWIATGHAAQYLWITSWYARASPGAAPSARTLPWMGRVLLAGAAVWTLPSLLFAPGALGTLPFDAGLAVLIAASVNLHHFVLDGAIWKLRDGRVARVLLRDRSATAEARAVGATPRRRLRAAPLVWATGAACLLVMFGAKLESEWRLRDALRRGDPAAAHATLERLRWIGRDSARGRLLVGRAFERAGNDRAAARAYRRALALQPSPSAWLALAGLRERRGQLDAAERAYRASLALDDTQDAAHYRLGLLLLRRGEPGAGGGAVARALALAPERGIHRTLFERASRLAATGSDAPPEAAAVEALANAPRPEAPARPD